MSINSKELERLRYRQGQMLRSRDFRDQVAIEAQLRWWHNRALHNTFGVSLGLITSPVVNQQGSLIAIRITLGLAYDCFGRELILQEEQEIPVPGTPQNKGSITLLMSYKGTNLFPKKDGISGICIGNKLSQSHEQPEFIWEPSKQVALNDGVPLAIVNYRSGTPSLDEEFTVPISRALARPRIASGSTIPGSTAWEAWDVKGQKNVSIPLGFQVRINTSAAGFTEVPCYFAWLQGPLWSQGNNLFFIAPLEHTDEQSISGFIFRLWMPTLNSLEDKTANEDFKSSFLTFAQKQGLYVCWVGIQP